MLESAWMPVGADGNSSVVRAAGDDVRAFLVEATGRLHGCSRVAGESEFIALGRTELRANRPADFDCGAIAGEGVWSIKLLPIRLLLLGRPLCDVPASSGDAPS